MNADHNPYAPSIGQPGQEAEVTQC
jgi:hypothetical protein